MKKKTSSSKNSEPIPKIPISNIKEELGSQIKEGEFLIEEARKLLSTISNLPNYCQTANIDLGERFSQINNAILKWDEENVRILKFSFTDNASSG